MDTLGPAFGLDPLAKMGRLATSEPPDDPEPDLPTICPLRRAILYVETAGTVAREPRVPPGVPRPHNLA